MIPTTDTGYEGFEIVLEELVNDILGDPSLHKCSPDAGGKLENILHYRVLKNARQCGYLVPQIYHAIYEHNVTSEDEYRAHILGWCWQMLQTFLELSEDSQLLSPQICMPTTTQVTVEMLLENAIYATLGKYFAQLPIYAELREYFASATHEYIQGHNAATEQFNFDTDVDVENYWAGIRMANFKSRFAGPTQLALILAGYQTDSLLWGTTETFCENLMQYWVVKRDVGDSFIENGRTVAIFDESDIKSGKFTWLVMKAREICTMGQSHALKAYYGKSDMVSVGAIKGLYKKLEIDNIGREHVEILRERLYENIEEISGQRSNLGEIFQQMLIQYND